MDTIRKIKDTFILYTPSKSEVCSDSEGQSTISGRNPEVNQERPKSEALNKVLGKFRF